MKRFVRTKEDFVCIQCAYHVEGNGYTNHCPHCLWSRHVDKNPGDRMEACKGMMKPIGLLIKGQRQRIMYRCVTCACERVCDASPRDSADALIALSKIPVRYSK